MVEVLNWISQNWFASLNASAVVGSLLFTAVSLRAQRRTNRVANLLTLTANHRDIWVRLFERPNLRRVLQRDVDLDEVPLEWDEALLVRLIIVHLHSVYRAISEDLLLKPQGLRRDVWWLFSLPIPCLVWEKTKVLHDDDFVAFVEDCRNWK